MLCKYSLYPQLNDPFWLKMSKEKKQMGYLAVDTLK